MKKQIQSWGTRSFALVLVVFAAQHWGMPVYKQYMTPKKSEVFVPTTQVRQGVFQISFQEIGTLESETSVPVISEISGKITSITPEGTPVKAGDKLIEMDTTDIDRRVREEQLRYQDSLTEVTRAKTEQEILKQTNLTELAKAQAQLDFDKTELQRAKDERDKKKRLADEKLVPRDQVDNAELDVRAKELAVKKGEMDLALKQKEIEGKERQKAAEVRKVEFAATMAKSEMDDAQSHRNGATILAPSTGMVVIAQYYRDGRQKFKVGDVVERKQKVCELPDLTKMQVSVNVGEADAPKVKLGQKVFIRLEAVPGKVFHGNVRSISPLATEAMFWEPGATPGRKNFQVVVPIKEVDPKNIKPGMTADVEFVCDTLAKSTYVPLECVQEKNGKTFCFVKQGKRFERRAIKTGKQNDNYICVIKGLARGEQVALVDPTKPVEGEQEGTSTNDANSTGKQEAPPMPEQSKK